jgi:thiamine-monophosphate kinase
VNAAPALSEDELIAAIAQLAGSGKRVLLGIGDDAALWQPSRSHRSAITSDMLVEGVHFTRELLGLEDAGWRAMAANASDLAAMGARPVLATVALGVPQAASRAEILELYAGLAAAARASKLTIAGGDLSRAPVWTIAIAAVGEVRATEVRLRSSARKGDVIAVTGPLGAARAGWEGSRNPAALAAFARPAARVAEGRFLAASRNVHAMMDCSDGLSTDLHRLCTASGCGAQVECVPVAPAAAEHARATHQDPEQFALAGGEDFELLLTVAPRAFAHLAARFRARFGRELTRIGTICAERGVAWRGEPMAPAGWDHFRP